MTDQLRAAIDQLNACTTADAVAALLRRHGIRASAKTNCITKPRSCHCPIAVYLIRVGGLEGNFVVGKRTLCVGQERYSLASGPAEFIGGQDAMSPRYPDLEAA